jgi:Bacterial Ig-like domain (group 2)
MPTGSRPFAAVLALLGSVLSACGGGDAAGPDQPQPMAVASVEITPATVSLQVGATTTLTATPRSSSGAALSGRSVTWSSSNAASASVSDGVVTAVGPGSATITATSEGRSGSAQVSVAALAPATLSITAGNGQQAEPGAAVAVRPVVSVTDASGRAVAGVAVTFSVDSGGGSVQTANVTTAADGTASPGDWRMGNDEVRNVLRAVVGGLPPVSIVATAVVQPMRIATQTIPSGGGTITISSGVLAGTRLVIPNGAFTTSANWTLDQRSNADWPRRRGVHPVGAALRITSTDTGAAAQPLRLTLPIRPVPGTIPFVLMRDRATNAMQVLSTVTIDSTSITVAAQHFDPSWMSTAPSPVSPFRSAAVSAARVASKSYDTDVMVSAITLEELNGDVDTGFRPGTDDWDVAPFETSIIRSNPNRPEGPLDLGAVLSQMAYFATSKASQGALFRKYREIPTVSGSNKVGIRSIALEAELTNQGRFIQYLTAIRNSALAGQADQTFYNVLKANLIVSGLPQLLSSMSSQGDVQLTAYRTVGNRIDLANPFTPGVGTSIEFSGGRFAAFSPVADVAGGARPSDWIGVVPVGQLVNMSVSASQIATFARGQQPGDIEWWPRASLKGRGGFVEDSIVYLGHDGDTTRLWVECADCTNATPSALPPGKVVPFSGLVLTGNWTVFANGAGALGALVTQNTAIDTRMGIIVAEQLPVGVKWLDFQWVRLKRWTLALAPAATAVAGVPTTITVTREGSPLIPAHEYVWTFGTGPSARVLTTTTPSVTTTFNEPGQVAVDVRLRRTSDARVLAKTVGTVPVDASIDAWKFNAVTATFTSAQPQGSGYDARWRVDSTIFARIGAGASQGGIRFVSQAFTPTGFPPRTAPVGLYLLEGALINLANLEHPLTTNNFITTTFPDAPLALPAAPQVSGWNLVQLAAPMTPTCLANENSYTFTGTIVNGHLTGRRVPLCVQSAIIPQINGARLMSMEADVNFGATTANGTITVVYYFYGNGSPANAFQRTARLTFSAIRLTP